MENNNTALMVREEIDFLDDNNINNRIQIIEAQIKGVYKFYKAILKKGTHFDKYGSMKKDTLLLNGAQQIARFLKLSERFIIGERNAISEEIHYFIECEIYNQKGEKIGTGVGSCTSKESRYSYYKNPYEIDNTILKMAKKRAFVDAVIRASGASDIFTQDMEDLFGEYEETSVLAQKEELEKLSKFKTAVESLWNVKSLDELKATYDCLNGLRKDPTILAVKNAMKASLLKAKEEEDKQNREKIDKELEHLESLEKVGPTENKVQEVEAPAEPVQETSDKCDDFLEDDIEEAEEVAPPATPIQTPKKEFEIIAEALAQLKKIDNKDELETYYQALDIQIQNKSTIKSLYKQRKAEFPVS